MARNSQNTQENTPVEDLEYYASVMRTRFVKGTEHSVEYRRAELAEDGKNWHVKSVTILNLEKIGRKAEKGFTPEGEEVQPKSIVCEVKTLKVYQKNSNDTLELHTFEQALQQLSNLEYEVIKNHGPSFATEEDVKELFALDKDAKEYGFIKNDYEDVDHYIRVANRHDIIFTQDGKPSKLKNGRLIQDGTYILSDTAAALEAMEKAAEEQSAENRTASLLQKAFGMVSQRKLDNLIKGSEILKVMRDAFQEMAILQEKYAVFYENPSDRTALNEMKIALQNCSEAFDKASQETRSYVKPYLHMLNCTELSANLIRLSALEAYLLEDANKEAAMEMKWLAEDNQRLLHVTGYASNMDKIIEAAVEPAYIGTMIEAFNKNYEQFRNAHAKNPNKAVEKAKTFTDRKPSNQQNKEPK